MAIAFGGVSAYSFTSTFNGPTISGSNVLGLVYTMGDASDNLTGITWVKGGSATAMTKITSFRGNIDRFISVWYITNPDSGGQIVMTGGTVIQGMAAYYTGVHQTTPIDSFATGTAGTGATVSATINVVNSNCWIVDWNKDPSGGSTYTMTTPAGTTRQNNTASGTATADTNTTVSTGNNTVTMTASSSVSSLSMIITAIRDANAAATANGNFLQFM